MNLSTFKIAAVVIALSPVICLGQGSLTPPGAPAPTMKTLEQVEPRIPISGGASMALLIINTPGSYYFTGHRHTSGNGIRVQTNGVTIDLNGFSLRGSGGATVGIAVTAGTTAAPREQIIIRNGFISDYNDGVQLAAVSGSMVENVTVSGVSNVAFYLSAEGGKASGNTFRGCVAIRAAFGGFYLVGSGGVCGDNLLVNCSAMGSPGTASPLSGFGFYLIGGTPGVVSGNILQNCTASANLRDGFRVAASSGQARANRITGCTATDNGQYGFFLNSAAVGRLEGNVVQDSQSSSNQYGIFLSGNGSAYGNLLTRNVCLNNTQRGIWTLGSTAGLTTANLCVNNPSGNFVLVSSDFNGPIVTTTGTLPNTGDAAHPHANFAQ
jgi:parallel beta-helix repeat protein